MRDSIVVGADATTTLHCCLLRDSQCTVHCALCLSLDSHMCNLISYITYINMIASDLQFPSFHFMCVCVCVYIHSCTRAHKTNDLNTYIYLKTKNVPLISHLFQHIFRELNFRISFFFWACLYPSVAVVAIVILAITRMSDLFLKPHIINAMAKKTHHSNNMEYSSKWAIFAK